MDTVKSFFIIEFKSIASGYLLVTSLVQKFTPNVIEIFSQAPGKLVLFCESSNTNEIIKFIKQNKTKVLDFCEITGDGKPFLNAFYGHTKPSLSEAIIVLETKTISSCFRLVELACQNMKIKVIEIDSGRALCGKAVAFLTGPKIDCEKFKSKNKKSSLEILSELPSPIKSLWAPQ